MKKMWMPLYAAILVSGMGTAAFADIISVSLTYTNATERPLLAAPDSAGVVSAANWNQIVVNDRDNTGVTPGSIGLTLSSGAASGATLSHSSSGGAYVAKRTTNATSYSPNEALMAGLFTRFGFANSGSHSYEVSDLPSAFTDQGYNVYVYVNSADWWQDATHYGQYNLVSGATYDETIWAMTGNRYTNTFINAGTGSTQGTAGTGNYILFTGLTDDAFTLTALHSSDSTRSGINGIQIVAIPEPGSMILMGIGVTLIGFFRRFIGGRNT